MPSVYSIERFENRLGVRAADLSIDQLLALRAAFLRAEVSTVAIPSFRKTHDAWSDELLPSELAHAAVYIVRDPRDVALSYAHHNGWPIDRVIAWMGNTSAYLIDSPEGRPRQLPQYIGDWNSHVLSWTRMSKLPLLVLRYEYILAQPYQEFSACVRFLGLPVNDSAIAAAIASTSFDVLQSRERLEGFVETVREDGMFFRVGRAGLWREQLSAAQAWAIEEIHREAMERFGYVP